MKTYRWFFLSVVLLAVFCFAPPLNSATLIVTNTGDTGSGSLRAGITAAAPGDTITFDPSLNGQTIVLTSGQIAINKTLTINGPGATNLAISGNNTSRIFNISATT